MKGTTTHEVSGELAGKPLDGVVRALFGATWGKARAWIESGKVSVDGRTILEPTKRVREGARVELAMNAPRRASEARPHLGDDAIVHVDAHVVVVNKPAGISTIPYEETDRGTLDELVRAWLSKRAPRGDRGARPNLGVVHRLDKETSGLLVFTRTWLAKKSLAQQFREHTAQRRYLAIVHGALARARRIESMLVENRGDGVRGSLKRGSPPDATAQRAITHVAPVEALEGATLVECRLETGRTHQIRIHLSEAGHPLVGERVYVRGWQGDPIPAPRMMLHAAELGFVHPATGVEARFEREPPPDFAETLARLRR
jgi:23S rRNA pseudouridine1911/1915/1917 synthase